MAQNWTFLGRDDELAKLSEALLVDADSAQRVVLVGGAGVGKTRLVTELLARAATGGTRSRLIQATRSAASVPLGCLAELLRPRIEAHGGGMSPTVLFHEALSALMAEATAPGQWILAVDDVNHLDDASAAVIHQCLVASGTALLGTAREHERRPDALDALWRNGSLTLRNLAPLSDDTVGELAELAVGGVLHSQTRQLLVNLAAGNPLALRELLDSARETATLKEQGGSWMLVDGFQAGEPLRDLIANRLANTSPAERQVLELIALGEPLRLDTVLSLAEPDLVDGLLERSMIQVIQASAGDDPTVRSSHPLHGEVLRAQLPPGRRRRLAGQVEAALASDPIAGPTSLRRALLHLEAGPPANVDLLASAAMAARAAGDHPLACRLADAALSVQGGNTAARTLATLAGAVARHSQGDDDAADWFEAAFEMSETDNERTACLGEWAWAWLSAGNFDTALALLERKSAAIETRTGRILLATLRSDITGYSGRWGVARDQARRILDDIDAADGPFAELAACTVHAMASAFDGPSAAALASAQRARELLAQAPHSPPNLVVFGQGGYLYALGETEGYESAAAEARGLVEKSLTGVEYLDYAGMWCGVLANQAVAMGALTEQSRRDTDEAVRLLRWRDPGGLLSFAVASRRGSFAAMIGDLDGAERDLTEYDEMFRLREFKTTAVGDRGRAWLAFQRGDLAGARQWAERAWSALWETGDVALWAAPAAHDLARFGWPELAIDRIEAAHGRLQGRFSGALAAHARALNEGDPAALVAAAELLHRCNAVGLEAEALAQAAQLSPPAFAHDLRCKIGELLLHCLLRSPILVPFVGYGTPSATSETAVRQASRATLVALPGGRLWRLCYGGVETVFHDLTGMAYLATLVANPSRPVRASLLAAGTAPAATSAQPILDEKTRQALEQRAPVLVEELTRARRLGQEARVEALETEAEALTAELARHRGLRGRQRHFTDADERARTAVRKAIVRSLDEIETVHAEAAQYLRARIATGVVCIFQP